MDSTDTDLLLARVGSRPRFGNLNRAPISMGELSASPVPSVRFQGYARGLREGEREKKEKKGKKNAGVILQPKTMPSRATDPWSRRTRTPRRSRWVPRSLFRGCLVRDLPEVCEAGSCQFCGLFPVDGSPVTRRRTVV